MSVRETEVDKIKERAMIKKLDQETKKRWVEALRSGRYEQGEGVLCSVGTDGVRRYCCLGVLFEVISGQDAWVEVDRKRYDPAGTMFATPDGERYTYGGELMDDDTIDELTQMNDERCESFDHIADFIEDEL